MPRSPEEYRVLLQDTGDPLTRIFGKITREQLIDLSVGPLKGYAIDAYCHCVNHAGGVYHDSDLREKIAQHVDRLASGSVLQMTQAIDQLIGEGNDCLAVYAEGAHALGMDYFLRLRMNDLHDRLGYLSKITKPQPLLQKYIMEPYYYPNRFKLDHPEYLLGDPDKDTTLTTHESWESGALNYALGAVREYNVGLAKELVNKYDLDGLELCFVRHPFLFASSESYAQRHVMTEVIRHIHKIVKEAAAQKGRPIHLSARVLDSVEQNLMIGIDVQTWLAEGLLDLITISGGYCLFGTPWHQIASLAKHHGVPALATLSYSKLHVGREGIRAAVERMYAQGIQGVELWNFFYEMEFYHEPDSSHLGYEFTRDLAEPEKLKTLPRTYYLPESVGSLAPIVAASQLHGAWPGQVPLTIGHATDGIGNVAVFEIGEAPAVGEVTLTLEILNLGPDDQIQFFWNNRQIHKNSGSWVGNITHDRHRFEFTLTAQDVYAGENKLEMKLLKRHSKLPPYVILVEGKLRISPDE